MLLTGQDGIKITQVIEENRESLGSVFEMVRPWVKENQLEIE